MLIFVVKKVNNIYIISNCNEISTSLQRALDTHNIQDKRVHFFKTTKLLFNRIENLNLFGHLYKYTNTLCSNTDNSDIFLFAHKSSKFN